VNPKLIHREKDKMKMKKRILTVVLSGMLMLALAIPASASTKDTYITNFKVSATGYSPISGRKKGGPTSVYLYITDAKNSKVRLRAEGSGSLDGKYTNYTWSSGGVVSYVTCAVNKKYSIQSVINERGKKYARLAFNSTNVVLSEKISGEWSPDSSGSYTVAK